MGLPVGCLPPEPAGSFEAGWQPQLRSGFPIELLRRHDSGDQQTPRSGNDAVVASNLRERRVYRSRGREFIRAGIDHGLLMAFRKIILGGTFPQAPSSLANRQAIPPIG